MRIPLLLTLLALCSILHTQEDYLPMLQADRTWCGIEGGWVPTPVTYWIETDTVLADGTLWYRMHIQYDGNPNSGLAGWFHEDVEAGQVWNRWDLDLDPGTLWFDFNLQPGDVMVAPNCDWADITCVAVEPFTWSDGTVSRRLTLELLPGNTEFVEHWIEGIGSENGPMGPAAYLCIADWDPHAACVVDAGAVRHDFGLDTTWLPAHPGCEGSNTTEVAAIESPSFLRLAVRDGQLWCEGEGPSGEVVLHDVLGRRLARFDAAGSLPIAALHGLLVAVLPDGSRHKIRID